MSALTTREALARALHATMCNSVWDIGHESCRRRADALLASGAVVDVATLADDDAVYDTVENAVMVALLAHGHADGCWVTVTDAALRALAAALNREAQA